MGRNLGPLNIKDSYEGLVQISGSDQLTDGSGSLISSLDISASFASQAGTAGFATTSTSASFADQAGTSGFATSASFSDQAGTSGFASTATSASFADQSGTSGFATSASYAETASVLLGGISLQRVLDTGNTATEDITLTGDISATNLTASGADITNLTVNEITGSNAYFTSASIGYLQTITGSAKIIGDAFIILNNDTPTERYAGLIVQDSGSTNNTASFQFDGQTNDWFYQYTDDGGATDEYGVVMFGPGYNTKGAHVYPSNNTILKGTGDHHIVDSSITDDGTLVTVDANISSSGYVSASEFIGDGSKLTGIVSNPTLQDVTTNGNETTNNIIVTGSIVVGADNLTFTGTDSAIIASATGSLTGGNYKAMIASKQSTNSATADNNVIVGGRESNLTATGVGNGMYSTEYCTLGSSTGNSVLIGGYGNSMNGGGYSSIIGGESNQVTQGYSHIIGSVNSTITSGDKNIILGGESNSATGNYCVVAGGDFNTATNGRSGVFAGLSNTAQRTGTVVLGGQSNTATQPRSAIVAGSSNDTDGQNGAIIAGSSNSIATNNSRGVIVGGQSNSLGANADDSVVLGGSSITGNEADSVYVPNLVVSGSIKDIDGGQVATSSSLGTGSLVDNIGQNISTEEAVEHVVYCTQAEYDAITPNENTLYLISGSTEIVDNLVVSGSMIGQVREITPASNTGSLDCSLGNYFTMTLGNAVDTRLEASNIQIGQTINLKLTNNATAAGTISFDGNFEFEGGTAFEATAATDAVDIITAISFDGTSLQVVGVKNFS